MTEHGATLPHAILRVVGAVEDYVPHLLLPLCIVTLNDRARHGCKERPAKSNALWYPNPRPSGGGNKLTLVLD